MPSRQQLEIEFEELLNRHSLTINKICWVYSEYNRFYFDELRSRCVIDLWREFSRFGTSRFRGESSEATWVYQIVLHAAARYFRNPHNLQFPSLKEQTAPSIASEDFDAMAMIEDLTLQLNNTDRLLLMHYLDNHSYSTIAEQDNISEASARKRMSRLLSKIRSLITTPPSPREKGKPSSSPLNEKSSNP